ncbi:hypothetical protein OIB37_28210 [Streptomyces sp. NBC_00820]|uniref:hypothetical protein n=1 Tax=Streptomyces sp. NBC_00820 TaxID=2975842 RepID=UPI002ED2CA47|nr:hypothetical protein OIB37_28210 [Streptomyces sp. NBC_00820]
MRQIDTRLIQTAVIGGPASDQPVILPEQPHNLDEFLRQFGRDDFWCGRLLGGCGRPLRPKRYVTKVCHFAHEAGSGSAACRRTTYSANDADHLFIKAHVTRWLATQGHAAHGELRSFGHCHGDAVDFWLRRTKTHLRFELHPEDYRIWRKAADSLGAKEGRIEWVFAQDDALTHDMVARRGYALRVRCETYDNDRRVFIGTVTDGKKTVWAPLGQCRMTDSGLVTPALEQLRAEGVVREGGVDREPLPASLPLSGGQVVFAVDTESAPVSSTPFAMAGRYLVPGFVKAAGSRIVRAHLSLPDKVPAPTDQYVYRLAGIVRLLVTDVAEGVGTSWTVRADALVRLNGLDAERTGLWRPSVALDEKAARSVSGASPLMDLTSGKWQAPEIGPEQRVAALRKALEAVAAKGTTIASHELVAQMGKWLYDLSDPKRVELLVEVDSPLVPGRPLLSPLIVTAWGRPLPYLGEVLRKLGVDAPASGSALLQWAAAELRKAHEAYGRQEVPASAAPSRAVDRLAVKEKALSESEARWAYRRRTEMQERLKEAAEIRAREGGRSARARRLTQAIKQGDAHLALYEEVRPRGRALRVWLMDADRLLDDLGRLIGRPIAVTIPVKTEPRTVSAKPTPEKKKDPHLRKIRRLLGEMSRPSRTLPAQELLRLLEEIKEHRGRLSQPLPDAEAKLVARWQHELAAQRSAELSAQAATSSPNAAPGADRTAESPMEDHLPAETIGKLAATVKGILEELARAGSAPLNWRDIWLRANGQLPPLHTHDQIALLVAADRSTPADEPLLSTLVNSSDVSPHGLYRQVRLDLGRKPIPASELEVHRATEVLRLRQIWRYRR